MTRLFDEHRFSEGTLLWIEARRFDWWNMRGAVAVDPGAFHHWRRYLREWSRPWSDLLVELARAHLKRGASNLSREAIAALREQAGPNPPPEVAANLGRALGIEAMSESPDTPVAALASRLAGVDRFGREAAYEEIAAHQARLGRWREFDRAVAAIEGTASHSSVLARLPCLARAHPSASLREAMRRAAAGMNWPDTPALGRGEIESAFWCLIEARRVDSAIEVAGWARETGERASKLARAANSADLAGGDRTRRRLAGLALADVEALGLRDKEGLFSALAGAYERLGDKAMVDDIIGRADGPSARLEILLALIRDYRPHPPMLEWIYGFARDASY